MNESPARIRVLLIEDNKVLLEGLSRLVSEAGDLELAGAVRSASAGLALFTAQRPPVTVIDLDLPGTKTAELVKQIRQIEPSASILIIATYELDQAAADTIESGAAAIIAKNQIASRLIPSIRSFGSRS